MGNQVTDLFNTGSRGTPNAWSPSSSGGWAWQQLAGTATMGYSSGQSEGTLTGDTSINVLQLGTNLYYYTNVVATFSKNSSLNSTIGVLARIVNGNTYYAATYKNGMLSLISMVGGSGVSLGTYSFSESVGTDYNVRIQVSGQNSNIVKARIWTGGSEPSSWHITSSADTRITTAGGVGVYGQGNSNSEVLDFTGFLAADPASYSVQIASSPYGVNLQNNPGNNTTGIQMLRDAVNAGYTWLRWQFTPWSNIEPTQGTYNWTQLDAAVQACNAVGMNILVVIRAPASWALINPCGLSPSYMMDPTKLATFLTDSTHGLLYHYNLGSNGTIQGLEFGNEDYEKLGSCASGTLAAQLMAAVYGPIKALVPSMIVGGPAEYMSPGGTVKFWDEFFTAGGGANIDFINIHSYPTQQLGHGQGCIGISPNTPNPNNGQTQISALQLVQATAQANGYGNLPIWMTENAWAVTNSKCVVTPANQSLYYQQILDDCRTIYPIVAKHFWYDIGGLTTGSGTTEHYRPAYTMFQAYNQTYPTWGSGGGGGGGGSAYDIAVLSDNPQAYYLMDERVGVTAADDSGRSYTATYSSTGVTYGEPGLISGDPDTAVLFDGQTGQITCNNGPYTKGWTGFTLESWFELPGLSFPNNAPLWSNGSPASDNNSINFYVGAGGTNLYCAVGNGTTNTVCTATYSFLANTKYYVAATWDGTNLRLYINPTSTASASSIIFTGACGTPAQSLCIGANLTTGNNFPGIMAKSAIYKNVALAGARLLAHYNAGASGSAPAPIFTLAPTSLTPQSPGVTKSGTMYSATVSLGETSGSVGNATWTASSSLSGVAFSPSSGTLSPGGTPTLITISNIPALDGTFTFSGGEGEVPVVTTWTIAGATQAGGFALVANGAGVASFDHFRVTGYPDPALNLVACGRAGASVANYNANLPDSSTTVAMATSLDGVNWTAVPYPNAAISGITTQPAPTADSFAANTSANYTQTYETGGAASTWTWDTANSRLVATGGTNGLLIPTNLTGVGDLVMFTIMDYSDAGGLIWHYQNANNFYLLMIRDSGNTGGNANTLSLVKVSGGTSTTLVNNTAISFTRGTFRQIGVTMLGNVITATVDGVTIFSYTDTSPLAAGQVGLRNSTSGGNSTAHFYQLYCQPQGQLLTSMDSYVYSQLTLSSTDPLNTPQVLDVATSVTGPSIGMGAIIPSATYQQTFVSKNIDDLNRQSNYWWTIASSSQIVGMSPKQVIFQAENAVPAPFVAAQANSQVVLAGQTLGDILIAGLQVEYNGDSYCNEIILQNVQDTQTFTQTFVGDGKATSWTLTYPVAVGTVPSITLNGNPVSGGIAGSLNTYQYYYTPGANGIAQDSSQAVLSGLQSLTVTYSGTLKTDVQMDNAVTGTYPGTVAQDAYSLIDGTSGIVTVVIDVSQSDATVNMTVEQAQNYGADYLQRYGVIGRIVTFSTFRPGLYPGQQLSVFIPAHGMQNAQTLVTQVDVTAQSDANGYPLYKYAVVATEGPALSDWQKLFSGLFT